MKRISFFLLLMIMASGLFAYQGNMGIGLDMYSNTQKDPTTDIKDTFLRMKLFVTLMQEDLEIAPYFMYMADKEKTAGTLTDKYSELGFGSMFNFHLLKGDFITMATGADVSLGFGKYDEDFYVENSVFDFNVEVPVVLDVNLGEVLVFRTSQNIGGFNFNTLKIVDDKFSDSTFYWSNGFGPRFSLIVLF